MNTASNFDDTMRLIGFGPTGEKWRAHWDEHQASFPSGGPAFLSESFVIEATGFLSMKPAVCQRLQKTAAFCRANLAWARFAWQVHRMLGSADPEVRCRAAANPGLPPSTPEDGELFFGLVYLSLLPAVRESHRRLGVAEEITRDTLGDLELWIDEFRRLTGRWGFGQRHWLLGHLTAQLFRLGRLQFQLENFPYNFHAFEHRADGRIVLLAGDDQRFRADGQFADADGTLDPRPWTARLVWSDRSVTGHPVDAAGAVKQQSLTLNLGDWQPLLRPNDPTLGVHIPAIGPLDSEACAQSYQRALEFFPRVFPKRPLIAFTCFSWLLDPQFAFHLPASGNMVRFLRAFHPLPQPGTNDNQMFERVFDRRFEDIAQAPQKSSLQRAIVAHIQNGGRWRSAGGVRFAIERDWNMLRPQHP